MDEISGIDCEQQLIRLSAQLEKQRRLLQRTQKLYETERREWARLLHDDFGQSLAAIKSFTVAIKSATDTASEEYELADIIHTTANEMYDAAYDLMRGLRSGFIEELGLVEGIQSCIENSRLKQKGIKVRLKTDAEIDPLGALFNEFLLRIVQESLSGITRASNPSEIVLTIKINSSQPTERRKNPRAAEEATANTLPLLRKAIEMQITSNDLNLMKYEQHSNIFHRAQNYVEAFGGDYNVTPIDHSSLRIQLRLDISDSIEDAS